MACHVVWELLHGCVFESRVLPVHLQILGGRHLVLGTQNSPYIFEDIRDELPPVFSEDVLQNVVFLNPVLQARNASCSRCSLAKLDVSRHFREPVIYGQN